MSGWPPKAEIGAKQASNRAPATSAKITTATAKPLSTAAPRTFKADHHSPGEASNLREGAKGRAGQPSQQARERRRRSRWRIQTTWRFPANRQDALLTTSSWHLRLTRAIRDLPKN